MNISRFAVSTRARSTWRTLIICAAALWLLLEGASAHGGAILYVDDDAPPQGAGSSWSSAMNELQDALEEAEEPGSGITEIRIAQGTYLPTRRTDPKDPRSARFKLLNGLTVRGGYAGLGAPDPDAWDVDAYPTILSGDLDGDDQPGFVNYDENAYHVVRGHELDLSAVLEGVVITAGNANGAKTIAGAQRGGGLYLVVASPTIINCRLVANTGLYGAGSYCREECLPHFEACIFEGNLATDLAGAIRVYESSPTFTDCVFSNNTAQNAGGIGTVGSQMTIINCGFFGNSADGGGACFTTSDNKLGDDHTTIIDSIFEENVANVTGGAIHGGWNTFVVATGCQFTSNTSGFGGGATLFNAALANCVFQGNSGSPGGGVGGGIGGAFLIASSQGTVAVNNCSFEGSTAGWLGGTVADNSGSATYVNCAFSGGASATAALWLRHQKSLINCTIGAYSQMGVVGAGSEPAAVINLKNSIVYGNAGQQLGIDPDYPNASFTVSYSDIQGGWPGVGNIDADPLFVQPGCDNLRLAFGSPCIDAASNALLPPGVTTDLDGQPRIQNSIVDMGAYEGGHEMLPPVGCADDLDEGEQATLAPAGYFSPLINTAIKITNIVGPNDSSASVTEILDEVHPNAGGYSELGAVLAYETTIADGQHFSRVYVPFDEDDIGPGGDPLAFELTVFDPSTGDWVLGAELNVQNNEFTGTPLGQRHALTGNPPQYGLTGYVGDYGVFFNPSTQRGFVWANVDHVGDFAFGLPVSCAADVGEGGDGHVGLPDLLAVIDSFGQSGGGLPADINHDDVIDIDDLFLVIAAWGPCEAEEASPLPATGGDSSGDSGDKPAVIPSLLAEDEPALTMPALAPPVDPRFAGKSVDEIFHTLGNWETDSGGE